MSTWRGVSAFALGWWIGRGLGALLAGVIAWRRLARILARQREVQT